jgi:hypothetical protein
MGKSYQVSAEGALKIDGHDDAFLGSAVIWRDHKRVEVLVYSGDKIVGELMERDGMTLEEAVEYVEYNIEDAYVGDHTPVVLWENTDLEEY